MANTILKASQIASMALGLLQREIVLPATTWNDAAGDFNGAANDTVNIRIPATLASRDYGMRNDRSSAITIDSVAESSIPIVLDKMPYSAVGITDEEMTLDIRDFGRQILAPQVRGIVERLENDIATEMAGSDINAEIAMTYGTTDPWAVVIAARKALNTANVPMAGRFLVLGANVEEAFLASAKFTDVDTSGASAALREAVLGRLGGFTVLVSNAIPADKAYAYHRTAFAFAHRAPVVPTGVVAGSSMSSEGMAMRWIRQYDPTKLQDQSVISCFSGTAEINDGPSDKNVRAVRINGAAS